MADRHFSLRAASFSAALFLALGIYLPFFPVWLDGIGLDPSEVAIVLSVPLFLRAALNPLLVAGADRMGELRRSAVLYALLATVFFAGLAAASQFWPILILSAASMVFWTALIPISDAVILQGTRVHGIDYSRVRLWGSIAFVAGAYGVAEMVRFAGTDGVFIALVAAFTAGAVAAAALPSVGDGTTPQTRSGLRDMLRDGTLARALIASSLIMGAHGAFYTFGTIFWRGVGFSDRFVAVLWGLGIGVEIVLFWYAKRLVPWGARRFILVAAAAAVVRWVLFPHADTPAFAAALQLLHGLTFAAAHLGAIMAIGALARPGHTARLQAGYQLFGGVVLASAILVSGPLAQVSFELAFGAMAALSLAALAVAWTLRRGIQPQSEGSGGSTSEPR